MEYRTDLGIDKDQTFGVEIEFSDVKLSRVKNQSKEEHLPIKYIYNHNRYHLPYDVWYLDQDCTVSEKQKGKPGIMRFTGGELSSKIMHDTEEDWIELKQICQMLQTLKAKPSSCCSNHVTVDISKAQSKKELYETLTQILAIYEPEIYSFYMGDTYLKRITMDVYAKLIRPRLLLEPRALNFLEGIEKKEKRLSLPPVYTNLDAINIKGSRYPNQIEFRYPNGTISEKTIQNNINFTIKLLQAINRGRFKKFKLNKQVSRLISSAQNTNEQDLYNQEPRDNYFDQLIDAIATSKEDKEDFYTQYQKVKKTKPKM